MLIISNIRLIENACSECVTNNIESSWEPLAQWLRSINRHPFTTETGGGNTASCVEFLCQQIAYQAQNSDGERPFLVFS